MNKKTKYQRTRGKSDKLDSFALLMLLHCRPFGDYPTLDRLRSAWLIHRETILTVWISLYPATRPLPYWIFDRPESYKKLIEKTRGRIDAEDRPLREFLDLDDCKAELFRLDELGADELKPMPEKWSFSLFSAAYLG